LNSSDESTEIEARNLIFYFFTLNWHCQKFTCPPHTLTRLTSAVTAPGISNELLSSELIYAPLEEGESPDEGMEAQITDLVRALEEDEDTLRVWTTLDK
jgi:transcriptional/translational regulatory protein YebC/TACO1